MKRIYVIILFLSLMAFSPKLSVVNADQCDRSTINAYISDEKSREEYKSYESSPEALAKRFFELREDMKKVNFKATQDLERIIQQNSNIVFANEIEDAANQAIESIHASNKLYNEYRLVAREYYISPEDNGKRQEEIDKFNDDAYFQLYFQVITIVRSVECMEEILYHDIPRIKDKQPRIRMENMYRGWITKIVPELLKNNLDFLLHHPYNDKRGIQTVKRYDLFNHLKNIAFNANLLSDVYPEDLDVYYTINTICFDNLILLHKSFGLKIAEKRWNREEQILAILKKLRWTLKSQHRERLWRQVVERYSCDLQGRMAREVFRDVDYSYLDSGIIADGLGFMVNGTKIDPYEALQYINELSSFIENELGYQEKYMWDHVVSIHNYFAKKIVGYSKRRSNDYAAKIQFLQIAYNVIKINMDLWKKYQGSVRAETQLPYVLSAQNAALNAEIEDADVIKRSGNDRHEMAMGILTKLNKQWVILEQEFSRAVEDGDLLRVEYRLKDELHNTMKNANRAAMKCIDLEEYALAYEFIKIAYDIYKGHEELMRRVSVTVAREQEAKGFSETRFETGRLKTNFRKIIEGLRSDSDNTYMNILAGIKDDENKVSDYLSDHFWRDFREHNAVVVNLKSA